MRLHGLLVVEDAACAAGARLHGRPIGASGRPCVFSFHPRKVLVTGEGGMLEFRIVGVGSSPAGTEATTAVVRSLAVNTTSYGP